jgi:aspartate racemase
MEEEREHRFTLGIVGGMGPLATAEFLRTLVVQTEARRDQDHLHVLIESDPSIPDRTAYLLGRGPDPRPAILRVARRLVGAGADLLVMPCNTANAFADDISASINAPLVPWISTAVEAVARYRPRKVGILATSGTLQTGVYQRAFAALGVATVQPREQAQRDVMTAIYGVGGIKAGGYVAAVERKCLTKAADALADAGAEVLLLACTELPLAMPTAEWPLPAVDPAIEVARRVIALAGLELRDDHAQSALAPRDIGNVRSRSG